MTAAQRRTPLFKELPFLPDSTERHAWDVWGRDDEIGSLNLVGREQVAHACGLVRDGRVVSLTLPLNEPDPGLFPDRHPYEHTVDVDRGGRDDKVDNFYLQFSSQWDGLRHVRFRQYGYWGGRQDTDLDAGDDLGIDRWSDHGLMGRGVLIDVARHMADRGTPLVMTEGFEITGDLISEIAAAEQVEFRSGDFLVLRTGWTEWYRTRPAEERAAMRGSVGHGFACPGLESSQDTAAFLWDHEFASVAGDNVAVERLPVDREKGFLHRRIIPLQGMALGEFWHLEELSAVCAETGRYDFLLVSAALKVPRGVGSPANAYAIV
ncbi:cyclase family protein [Geodermatophilus sp. URMC 64]